LIPHCPICRGDVFRPLFRAASPVFMMVRTDARPQPDWFAELDIVQCLACAHAFNRNFDDALASRLYGDVPLTNFPVHPSMLGRLASLTDWLGDIIQGRRILEIGGGSGHLARVLSRSAAEVVLYEPCQGLTRDLVPEPNIRLVPATYPQGAVEKVDVVICRQVIEHIADPLSLLRDIRRSLPIGGFAYLEVPDADYIDANAALPDLHLQHVQYFTRSTFYALAVRAGLMPLRTLDLMNGHDFGVLFQASEEGNIGFGKGIAAEGLAERLEGGRERARCRMASLPGPIALYGASPHSQVFLNHIGGAAAISAVLDDNPRNSGWALYNAAQLVPVIEAARAPVAEYRSIVIGAYLHDGVIAERLKGMGARCVPLSIRTAPGLPQSPQSVCE